MAHSIISEFEARRVERFLRDLYAGKLRRDETLSVTGTLDGQWLAIRWELRNERATLDYARRRQSEPAAGARGGGPAL
jgi:hypothetical protein